VDRRGFATFGALRLCMKPGLSVHAAGAGFGLVGDRGMGKRDGWIRQAGNTRERKKDVFSGERTQSSIANKGLTFFSMLKTNWFLMQTNSKRTPKRGQKTTSDAESSPNSRVERRWRVAEHRGAT